jgi:triacylglycerol lipase
MSIFVELPTARYDAAAFSAFTPQAEFHPGTARAMSWLCQLAYESNDAKIAEIAGRWHLARAEPFDEDADRLMSLSATRGLLVEAGAALIVAFTGTDPVVIPNLITDLDARRSRDGLHTGFENAAQAVWDDIAATLTAAREAARPVLITGHSLGGALAVLTASRALRDLQLRPAAIYTFGMPRVGDPAFADSYNRDLGAATYRMVHGADVVPTLPSRGMGYAHVGRRLHCERGGRFDSGTLDAAPGGEELASSNGLLGPFLEVGRRLFHGPLSPSMRTDLLGILYRGLPPGVADHLPDRYFSAFA